MTDQLIMDDHSGQPAQRQPALAELDDAARQGRFDVLQQRMEPVWDAWGLDLPDESVVVVPSVTVSRGVATGSALTQAFEERLLFLLLLLRQPRLRMIYVTSAPINPRIIEYYLALLPGVIPEPCAGAVDPDRRRRLDRPATEREAARTSSITGQDRGADPEPRTLSPHPVQHHIAGARPCPHPGHSHVRRRSAARRSWHQERVPATLRGVRRTPPARSREPAQPGGGDRRDQGR